MLNKSIASILGGTLVSGLLVANSFGGTQTIESANQFIDNAKATISMFKSNEGQLVNKVNELKEQKSMLEEQAKDLRVLSTNKDIQIAQLDSQIQALEVTIADLEQQIANGSVNDSELANENNRLIGELNKANSEIQKANDLVAQLQAKIDSTVVEQPMSEEELNNVTDTTTNTEQPTNAPFTNEELSSASKIFNREGYYTWQYKDTDISSYILVDDIDTGNARVEVFMAGVGTITITTEEGQVFTSESGVFENTLFQPRKIVVQFNDGTVKTVLVQR